jgi:hypothetical protein
LNAYQEVQTSGIVWSDNSPSLLNHPFGSRLERLLLQQNLPVIESLKGQMADFAAHYQDSLVEVSKHFVLPSDSSVRTFLAEHRILPSLLLGSVPHLKRHFGSSAVLTLRARVDEAGSRTLYAVVMWSGKLSDAVNALATFDREWWMARAGQAGGYLTFTYELA